MGGAAVQSLASFERSVDVPPEGRGARILKKRILLLAAVVLVIPGCMGIRNVLTVNICEPEAYCVPEDRKATFERNRALAEQVWAYVVSSDSGACYSIDYAEGFLEGYTDYLTLGGTGAAPPIPPRRYWNVDYRNPGGEGVIQEWFAGFEHGAAEAKASGYRQLAVVPSSVLCPLPPPAPAVAPGMPEAIEGPFPEPELVPTPAPQSMSAR
jgi:hypothetical protein